ncbi:MAG: hypothetical protein ACLFTQ_00405 [Candidatus Aenigmatarchaeota archaeon]
MSEIEDLMEKSREKLSTAELLLEESKYEDSVSGSDIDEARAEEVLEIAERFA